MGGNHIRNLKNDFKELLSLNISYESIRKYIFCGWIHYIGVMMNQNSLDILAMTHNGLCQRVNSGYRLDIFDTIRNMPVAYQISIMNQMKLLKILLTKAYPLKYRKAIVTDSKQGYDEIMNELGFAHQHCIFHLYKNILEAMQSEINKTVKNYKQELKRKHPELSDYKIKK